MQGLLRPPVRTCRLQHAQCPRIAAACRSRSRALRVEAISIDRRAGLDSAWTRDLEREARLERLGQDIAQCNSVLTVSSVGDLEALLDSAGTRIVVAFLYTRQCGVCKDAAVRFEQLRSEASRSKARVVFVRHDCETDYGDRSDISRLHNVRAVPCFLFFDGGAVVRRLSLRDIRRLTGPKPYVQAALAEDVQRLRRTFLEVLLSRAPSARS